MKKIFIFISILIFIISAGGGCANSSFQNSFTPPSSDSSKNIASQTSPSSTPISSGSATSLAIATKIFSDPAADFTFEYPSSLIYEKTSSTNNNALFNKEVPTLHTWKFSQKNVSNSVDLIVVESQVEDARAFGGCSDGYPEHRRHILGLTTFPTNNKNTSVVVEMCAKCADQSVNGSDHTESCKLEDLPTQTMIYWIPGQKVGSYTDLFKTPKGEINVKRISINPQFFKDNSFTKKQYLDFVYGIAKSIKIVKNDG